MRADHCHPELCRVFTMLANHPALRAEGQDLFEDQLRTNDTRSVRRASGLVLARDTDIIATGL